jgi:hypothetical protein
MCIAITGRFRWLSGACCYADTGSHRNGNGGPTILDTDCYVHIGGDGDAYSGTH